jgi:hypothetical protein
MAEYYRATPEELRKSLEQQGGEGTIENNLRTRKSIEALIAKAKVADGEWIDEKAVQPSGESKEEKPKKAAKKKAPAKKAAKASGQEDN